MIKEKIEYDCLVHDFGVDKVQPFLDIALDVLLTNKKEFVGINTELFRNRIWKLDMMHIQYAIWGMEKCKNEIKNPYAYLAKTLYQATVTQHYYYTTLYNFHKAKVGEV